MLRVILLSFIFFPFTAFGCSCFSETKSFEEEIKKYDAIFTGIAINTNKMAGEWDTAFYKTEMVVQQVWKNQFVPKSVFIKTDIESSSCGGPAPKIGNRFIVFAHATKEGLFETGGCSTFMDLEQIKKDLDALNSNDKEEWETIIKDMWLILGSPLVVYSK